MDSSCHDQNWIEVFSFRNCVKHEAHGGERGQTKPSHVCLLCALLAENVCTYEFINANRSDLNSFRAVTENTQRFYGKH